MAATAVYEAVKVRQMAGWTTLPVDYPNETFTPPADGAAFVQVDFPVADSEQISIGAPGANVFRDIGAIRFIVNVPKGSGLALAMRYAGEIADLFRGKDFSGVLTFAPTPPVYLGVDGVYAAVSTSIPYQFDHQG